MKTFASGLMIGASAFALASHAYAQAAGGAATAPATAAPAEEEVEAIVVTGSRIVRDGFQAPTPVTTLAQDSLLARSPNNIPDALNQLPQFRNSQGNTRSVTWNANEPNQGNYLNLRGLGARRSLVLLDGVRVPPTSFAGGVDQNTLPQALVQRVDVVTGGASAAYGSDALVGVINYVLDKNFTGLKGSVQAGIASRGDAESYRGTIAGGRAFAGGRGHVIGSLEYFQQRPVNSIDRPNGDKWIQNVGRAVSGVQYSETFFGSRFSNITHGGYILNGPLQGFEFLPGGTVQRMPVGTPTGNATYVVGGGGAYWLGHTLISSLETVQAFGRASYDLTENVNAHLQVSFAESLNTLNTRVDERLPNSPSTGLTIFADNPFLRPEVRAMLGNAQSFRMSRISYDTPLNHVRTLNDSTNINFGLDGRFDAFGREWTWDANYVYGRNFLRTSVNEFNNQRYYAAADAARDPVTGNIVCRVNLVVPNGMPGCVPINLFGVGAPSQAAIDYIKGYSQYRVRNGMDILAVNVSGDLFDLPAGPLSVAFGGEWRKQTLLQESNSDPAAAPSVSYAGIRGKPSDAVLIWDFTNIGSAAGAVKVKEAYLEVAAPILKDLPLAKSLDLNAAVRLTDYSTSGFVYTYKVGFSYQPVEDLRFRGTVSRDIAAPTLYALYRGTTVTQNQDLDLHTGIAPPYIREFSGNPTLKPEIGSMVVFGGVYSPSWLPGFQMSVDGYSLYITDAIADSNQGDLNRLCEESNGTADVCQYIIRPFPFSNRTPENSWSKVILRSLNQAKIFQSGADFEASYRFPLSNISQSLPGNLELRGLMSLITAARQKQSPATPTQNQLDVGTNPRYSGQVEGTYSNGPFSMRLAYRMTGSARRSITTVFVNYDTLPNVGYTDMTLKYMFGPNRRYETFLNVQNLFDVNAPLVADGANPGLQYPTNRSKYDVMGRYFTAGLRFRM